MYHKWKGADSHEGLLDNQSLILWLFLCRVEQLARQLDARQLDLSHL